MFVGPVNIAQHQIQKMIIGIMYAYNSSHFIALIDLYDHHYSQYTEQFYHYKYLPCGMTLYTLTFPPIIPNSLN